VYGTGGNMLVIQSVLVALFVTDRYHDTFFYKSTFFGTTVLIVRKKPSLSDKISRI